jgi:hypothetical protein
MTCGFVVGMAWRVAQASTGQEGRQAVAVAVSAMSRPEEGTRRLRADERLPKLPDFGIVLLKGREPRQPMTEVLAMHIVEAFR